MRRVTAGVLAGCLLAGAAGAAAMSEAAERDGPGGPPAAERRGSRTFQAAGWWSSVEPGPASLEYETNGAVWLPVRKAKNATCFAFEVGRTATETTVTAYCDSPAGRGKLMASFEVESVVWDGQFGEVTDSCRDRHDMRRNTVFTCTVLNPGTGGS